MTEQLFPENNAAWDVEAERAALRARLDEVRDVEGFPLGEDDAIVSLSLPPYQTACPNPFLHDWVEANRTVDEKREDPGPFVTDITVGKGNRFYKAHSYPTKVPHPAIMRFLLHYTKPGDVVLDGFAGSGSTGLAAQACGKPDRKDRDEIEAEMGPVQWGYRKAVLSDLAPSASVIAAGLNLPIDADAFDRASNEILNRFDEELGWMYETTHTNGEPARIEYTVWSEVFTCPECGSAVVFYDVAYDPVTGKVEEPFRCTGVGCGAELDKRRLDRRMTTVRTSVGDVIERVDLRPVRIHYTFNKQRFDKAPDEADHSVLQRVARLTLAGPVPTQEVPFMHMTHERAPMFKKGFSRVHHYWGDRALHSLAWLWEACSEVEQPTVRLNLLFWVEQSLW